MPASRITCSAAFLPSPMALMAVDAPRMASPPMYTFSSLVLYEPCHGSKLFAAGKADIRQLSDGRYYCVAGYLKFDPSIFTGAGLPALSNTFQLHPAAHEALPPCHPSATTFSGAASSIISIPSFEHRFYLSLVGGHLVDGAAVDDGHPAIFSCQPVCCAGGIHGGIAAADDDDFLADAGLSTLSCAEEELQWVKYACGVCSFYVQAGRRAVPRSR